LKAGDCAPPSVQPLAYSNHTPTENPTVIASVGFSTILRCLSSLKIELESKQSIEPEERNLAMQLSALYIEKIREARQEGELDLVRVLLKEIVGDVPPELNDRIALLSLDKIPELAKALLRFSSIDDLALWLTNN
jgi:Domain of unknown function (DUF4351)